MCNQWCLSFASNHLISFGGATRILEVGSRDVNGTVRSVLARQATEYVGVDLFPGDGVDRILDVKDLATAFGLESFDIVASTEMLEHCHDWREALFQMASVLRIGGVLLVTTRSPGFEPHDYPADYWRFSMDDFRRIFEPIGEILHLDNDMTLGWPCGIGVLLKRTVSNDALLQWRAHLDDIQVYSMLDEHSVGDPSHNEIIFDQYSRYAACAQLVRHAAPETNPTLLDVGSGPECLFGGFIDGVAVTYIDPLISPESGPGHIQGDVFSAFSDDRKFNIVTAVDVLEHVPPRHREKFLQRLSRLATDVLILGFPNSDSADPIQTDLAIEAQYRAVYGVEYPWLKEHHEYGLPSLADTRDALIGLGWHCQSVGHGHAPWLRELLGFVLCVWEKPAYKDLVFSLSERFKNELIEHDFTGPYYRQFLLASRQPIAPFTASRATSGLDRANALFRKLMDDAWSEYFRLSLNPAPAWRDAEIARHDAAMAQIEAEVAQRDAEISMLKQSVTSKTHQLRQFQQSLSWRITSPLRMLLRTYQHRGLAPNDRQFLRQLFKRGLAKTRPIQTMLPAKPAAPSNNVASLKVKLPLQAADMEDVFVWSLIDWHFRLQRPQHLATQLAMTGRRVFYFTNNFVDAPHPGFQIEELGSDGRLFQVRLHVNGMPAFYSAPPNHASQIQLRKSIATFLCWTSSRRILNLVQHPFWYEMARVLPNSRLIYDCMDHHEGFGNVSPDMLAMERALAENADLLVVTSQWLDGVLKEVNPNRRIIRNACQYEHFAHAPENRYQDPAGRRIIGYYGAIAEWFDLSLVREVAQAFPDCLILLVGEDTCNARAALSSCPNVVLTGEVAYGELPYYLYAIDVCLLPFHVVPLTLATNPVKLYEYLSAGKRVVAVDLPEMRQFGDLIQVATDHPTFLAKVRDSLNTPFTAQEIERRQTFAAAQTWSQRASQLVQAITACPEPMVSVIVVTYNNLDLTKACLQSLETLSDYPTLEIIVVDNASTDGSPEFLNDWVKKGSARGLILNEDNKGFAAANNQGLALARGDFLVLLNNDTYVTPGWARTLANHLRRDPSIGILGPVTNNIGNEARIEIDYHGMADMLKAAARHTRKHMGQTFPLHTAAFFCVMLRRAVYERVGPLDEAFGRGFFEDDDYCRRVEQLGLRVVCAEDVFIHHHLSASFSKLKDQERQALFERNRAVYEMKWGKWIPHSYRVIGTDEVPDDTPDIAVVEEVVPPIFEGWRHVSGQCNICGKKTRFFFTEPALWREQLTCECCRATSRYRSIARGVLRAIEQLTARSAPSLAQLTQNGGEARLRVYDTQPPFYYDPCAYPIPDLLKTKGWIDVALSQYKPKRPMGEQLAEGVSNQNLECLTFADESFDIVITSDVMEHVRLDDRAHREIHRILKPGGIYLFTVPHDRGLGETLIRVRVNEADDPDKDVHLLEPEYHGDTNSDEGGGVLSYRVYGKDLEDYLAGLGFEVTYTREDFADNGILNTELYYCRKMPDGTREPR